MTAVNLTAVSPLGCQSERVIFSQVKRAIYTVYLGLIGMFKSHRRLRACSRVHGGGLLWAIHSAKAAGHLMSCSVCIRAGRVAVTAAAMLSSSHASLCALVLLKQVM